MRQSIIKKLSFANVISVIALFVALSGAAYAGGLDLITGKGIENGSVTSKDIAENALTGKVIENGSITSKDIADDALTGRDIREPTLTGSGQCGPATPLSVGDLCFGPVQPVGTWKQALQNCQRVALKLPSIGEALQVSGQTQLRNTYNWTSDFVDVGSSEHQGGLPDQPGARGHREAGDRSVAVPLRDDRRGQLAAAATAGGGGPERPPPRGSRGTVPDPFRDIDHKLNRETGIGATFPAATKSTEAVKKGRTGTKGTTNAKEDPRGGGGQPARPRRPGVGWRSDDPDRVRLDRSRAGTEAAVRGL